MIIVTGGAGFIGSNLVADLNERGRSDILIVDDLGSEGKWRNVAKRRFLDIAPIGETREILAKTTRADVVFHMGANSSTTAVDADEILKTNLRCSMAWWRWCVDTRTPLIYASSAATYGNGALGFDDDESEAALSRLAPLNLYGWSKHAFDRWALTRAAAGDAPPHWAGLKFFNVYGPNEYHKGDMQSLVAKNTSLIAAGSAISLFRSHKDGFEDGEQLRDFVHVADCASAMLWLEGASAINGVFNLGTGEARSFKDLMLAIGKAVDRPPQIVYRDMPAAIRPNYQYFTKANMDKLRSMGYNASFRSIEDGVGDYVTRYLLQSDPHR